MECMVGCFMCYCVANGLFLWIWGFNEGFSCLIHILFFIFLWLSNWIQGVILIKQKIGYHLKHKSLIHFPRSFYVYLYYAISLNYSQRYAVLI